MNTFKKIVASPIVGLGWVAGQFKNGYDMATKAVEPVAKSVSETVVKAATATKTAATSAATSVKQTVVKAAESAKTYAVSGVAATKKSAQTAGTAVWNTLKYWAKTAQHGLSLVVLSVVLVGVTAFAYLMRGLAFLDGIVARGVAKVKAGWTAAGEFFTGEGGLVVAEICRLEAAYFGLIAGMLTAVMVLGTVFAPLFGATVTVAAVTEVATVTLLMVAISATFLMAAMAIEMNSRVLPAYTQPARRVFVVDAL